MYQSHFRETAQHNQATTFPPMGAFTVELYGPELYIYTRKNVGRKERNDWHSTELPRGIDYIR